MTCPLTIAITTRNRADFLGETLDSILAQLPSSVELLILDGASTDNTPGLVREYQARHPQLRYVRLDSNDGLDRDFDRSVSLSSGEYCWLMTDDDLLKPGVIEAVLAEIGKGPSLVIVNAEVRNRDLSEIIEARRLPFSGDRVYQPADFDRLFAETASYLSFIGCVVIRREVWLSRDRESYFGSLFVHMGVIFQRPLPGAVIALAEPYIIIRYGNAKWRPQQFEIWLFKWPEFVWSFAGVSPEAKARVAIREPWRNPARLLLYRAKGVYTRSEYTGLIRPRMRSATSRLGAWAVLLIPGALANALALIYCSLVKERAGFRSVDLKNSPHYYGNWLPRGKLRVSQ